MIATETAPIAAQVGPIRRTRRISMIDAEAIAKLCAKGHSEAHAVAILNKFTYQAWMHWKARCNRAGKVGHLFTRTLASRVDNLVEQIAVVSDIDRAKAAGVRHDWRAAQFLAGVVDPKFSTSPQASQLQVTVSVDESKLRRIADIYARTLTDAATPGALPAPAPGAQPGTAIDCPALVEPDHEPSDQPAGPVIATPDDWTDGTD